jgi:peptidyl-prolyl cis-trans isomerase C
LRRFPLFQFVFEAPLLSWFRSPVLHFLVLGALIFVIYEARLANPTVDDRNAFRIEVDSATLEMLDQNFSIRMNRAPNAAEQESLLHQEIEEEILFREALSHGLIERDGGVQARMIQKMMFLEGASNTEDLAALLDRAMALELYQDDIVVRRILVQKMRLLASRLDADNRPSDRDIAKRYAETREALREPDRISFDQVFLSADDRREATLGDARILRTQLETKSIGLQEAVSLGDPFPLGYHFAKRSERDLERSFGAGLGALALKVKPGEWSDPIESAYGHHLLFVEARDPGQIPPLSAVADSIRLELEHERASAQLSALLMDLQKRYEVVVTDSDRTTR